MALALNVFKTVTSVVSLTPSEVYSAPVGYTGVVLLSQVANIGATSEDVTIVHRRSSTDTEILKEFPISPSDTANLLAGKLVLESGDKLVLSGSNGSNLKFIASILETLN
jgi:fructose-1-phosphate kinase PfkB-like protein